MHHHPELLKHFKLLLMRYGIVFNVYDVSGNVYTPVFRRQVVKMKSN